MSRRLGGKEGMISVSERAWEVLEQTGVSQPSLGAKEERNEGYWKLADFKGDKTGGQIKLKKREQLKNLFKLGKIWMGVWVVKLFEWRVSYEKDGGLAKRHVESFEKGRVQEQ